MISAFLFAAMVSTGASTVDSPASAKIPYRQCRWLVQGASAKGDVKVCRTKAEWRQFDMCNSPTSYCSPEQKAKRYGRPTAFGMSEDSRIICKMVRATGSRLSSTKTCLPAREWRRMWDQSSETVQDLIDQSLRPNGVQP